MIAGDEVLALRCAQSLKDDPTVRGITRDQRRLEARITLTYMGHKDASDAVVERALDLYELVDATPRPQPIQRAHIPMTTFVDPTPEPPPEQKPMTATEIMSSRLPKPVGDDPRTQAVIDPVSQAVLKAAASAMISGGTQSLLDRVSRATSLRDPVMSGLLNIPRSTIQAMRAGHIPERLSRMQIDALLHVVRTQRAMLEQLDSEITMRILMGE